MFFSDIGETMIGVGEPVQAQVDVEIAQPMESGSDVSAPLLPVAMKTPDADPDDDGDGCCEIGGGCCQIAICGGSISNGGDVPPPDPDTPTSVASAAAVDAHAGWAAAFKLTVAMTFGAAVWTGGLAVEALVNDSLSGEGRRRLMHHNHGGHHSHNHHHHGGKCSTSGRFFFSCRLIREKALGLYFGSYKVPRTAVSYILVSRCRRTPFVLLNHNIFAVFRCVRCDGLLLCFYPCVVTIIIPRSVRTSTRYSHCSIMIP